MNEYFESTQIIELERTLLMGSPWIIQGSSGWGFAGWVGSFESRTLDFHNDVPLLGEVVVYEITLFPIDQQTFLLNEPLAVFAAMVKKEGVPFRYTTWGNREHLQRWIKSKFDCDCFFVAAGNQS
jgi:hypothetical protein